MAKWCEALLGLARDAVGWMLGTIMAMAGAIAVIGVGSAIFGNWGDTGFAVGLVAGLVATGAYRLLDRLD